MGKRNDDNLHLAQLVVSKGMTSQETVDRVLQLLESKNSEITLGELLLQLGHVTPEQFKELMVLRHKTSTLDPAQESQLFGEVMISRGLATPDQVNEALRDQAELAGRGIFKNIGELMVQRGILTKDQVRKIVREQDQAIMVCPACTEQYNVLRSWQGMAKCPADSAVLQETETDAGTGVGVAATLGQGVDAPESPIGMEAGGCRIVEFIARGSMGAVYKAKHVGLNRYVAIKLLPSISQDSEMVKRLLFEARAIARLEHPNIVQVYDVGFHKGYFFIVMQLLKGETLEDRLAGMKALPIPEALQIVEEVAQGLAAAHQKGIVHRDLKPANVMLTEDGHARLTDFGLAQDSENPDGREGLIVGTPYYMSPEQWLGHKADERSDLYSLGVILYQMVTGKRAFQGETVTELMHQHLKVPAVSPRTHDPTLSEGLCAVIRKMIAKPPRRRYPHVPEFLADLRKVAAGDDPDALADFGTLVKCNFCETFNPVTDKKCKVCGESLHEGGGPIDFAVRADEFKCQGCGTVNPKKAKVCGGCRRPFCSRCRQRLAVLKGYCPHCVPHLPRR